MKTSIEEFTAALLAGSTVFQWTFDAALGSGGLTPDGKVRVGVGYGIEAGPFRVVGFCYFRVDPRMPGGRKSVMPDGQTLWEVEGLDGFTDPGFRSKSKTERKAVGLFLRHFPLWAGGYRKRFAQKVLSLTPYALINPAAIPEAVQAPTARKRL